MQPAAVAVRRAATTMRRIFCMVGPVTEGSEV
jgi:hypothetical protein